MSVTRQLPEYARLFFRFVVVRGNDFVVEHEVVVFFVNFRQNVRERLVHHVHDLFAFKQLAILLNGEIAVKFTQNILRIGGRFDAHVDFSVHCVQHLTAFKLDRRVNSFVHQIRQCAFRTAETGIHDVPAVV